MDEERRRIWIWAALAAVAAFAAFRVASGGSERDAAAAPPVMARDGAGGGGSLWVHVAGEVKRPGLYRVKAGSRIGIAVRRAGGLLPRAEPGAVNLAARLEDGQQVLVPRRGQAQAAVSATAGPGPAAGAGGGAGPVSLGAATVEQLDGIDGIGPTLASRIVEYRQQNGGFSSLDELREVDGIGEKRFEALREGLRP